MFKKIFERRKTDIAKQRSQSFFDNYFTNNKIRKLQIGAGEKNLLEGWLNTDLLCKNDNVGYLDVGEKFPFKKDTFDFIYSEHIFEHLTFAQATNMLSECFRTLKSGGVIRMATPNLNFLINLYQYPELPLHKEYINWATKSFTKDIAKKLSVDEYTPVFVMNNFFRDWGHQIIHNPESITLLFKKAGFKNIIPCKLSLSLNSELCNLERHGDGIPPAFNEMETMVFEAIKL